MPTTVIEGYKFRFYSSERGYALDSGTPYMLWSAIRWSCGVRCAHCESENITKLQGKKHRPGTYQCNECRQQFTVTVGTIMHSSKLPLNKWILAFHLMCSSKKGVSALQIKRQLGLGSYRTAWHLCHRIRMAMKEDPLGGLLGKNQGIVEADETYVGGKPRRADKEKLKRGRGTKKIPVVALVDRKGDVRSVPVKHLDKKTLHGIIKNNVDKSATIMTDEWKGYSGVGRDFEGGHKVVNHGRNEFSRGTVHVNHAESYFSLFKRGFIGAFHQMSPKHMHRYCTEFDFRWTHRKLEDFERTVKALQGFSGKRLTYKPIVAQS